MICITLILPAHTPACVLFSTCERERGTINMVKKSIRGHVDVERERERERWACLIYSKPSLMGGWIGWVCIITKLAMHVQVIPMYDCIHKQR